VCGGGLTGPLPGVSPAPSHNTTHPPAAHKAAAAADAAAVAVAAGNEIGGAAAVSTLLAVTCSLRHPDGPHRTVLLTDGRVGGRGTHVWCCTRRAVRLVTLSIFECRRQEQDV
jgi:hypothetical protein